MITCIKSSHKSSKKITHNVKFMDDKQQYDFKDLTDQLMFKTNNNLIKESPNKLMSSSFDASYKQSVQSQDQTSNTAKACYANHYKRSSFYLEKFDPQSFNVQIIFETFNNLILNLDISIWATLAELKTNIFTEQLKFSEEQAKILSQNCEIYQNCTLFQNNQILYQKAIIECPQLQLKLFAKGQSFIESSYLPQLKNNTIELIPSLQELCLLSESELSKVPNLIIRNKFGAIEFLEPVDVTYTNFDRILKMTNYEITLYPKNFFKQSYEKPKPKTKLNAKCLIKFNASDIKEQCCDHQKLIVNQLIRECQQKRQVFQFFDNQTGGFTAMAEYF